VEVYAYVHRDPFLPMYPVICSRSSQRGEGVGGGGGSVKEGDYGGSSGIEVALQMLSSGIAIR
jgi:hypothetical protein